MQYIVMLMELFSTLEGKSFKIVGTSSGHGLPIGTKVTVESKNGAYYRCTNGRNRFDIFTSDLGLDSITAADLKLLHDKMNIQMSSVKDQLEYLEETKTDTLDSVAYYKFIIHKIIKADIPVAEKETKLYELIQSRVYFLGRLNVSQSKTKL